ncbi:MAG: phosphate acyltransferase PlsX [Anaerolineales bacterium]
MNIVLDAMGSDNHPEPEVIAAVAAAKTFGDEIFLVGQEDKLRPLLARHNTMNAPVTLVPAAEVFEMTDKISGSALRKAENSMGVGMNLLKEGRGDAFVTAGNTGGAMAIGLARLGRIKGVKRPALCALFPVKNGHAVVTDIGANAICKPEYLVQFAIMGSIYATTVLNIESPRVGLVSNGEEAGKGNDLVKETYPLLEASGLNFIGNIEGKELFGGMVDVAVTDGFTGNVLLKTSEAVAKLLTEQLKSHLMASLRTKVGGMLAKPAFAELRKDLDPTEVGAAPLLGLDGLVFVGHGRSDHHAILSAIIRARQAVSSDMLSTLKQAIQGEFA